MDLKTGLVPRHLDTFTRLSADVKVPEHAVHSNSTPRFAFSLSSFLPWQVPILNDAKQITSHKCDGYLLEAHSL